MKSFKIAVCITGQPRTWQHTVDSFHSFFASDKHEIDFFGHTWAANDWKDPKTHQVQVEYLNAEQLRADLQNAYGFTGLRVDPREMASIGPNDNQFPALPMSPCETTGLCRKPWVWYPMAKSCMLSNHLKSEHEFNSNITYDVVVHTRFDLCYTPEVTFDHYLDSLGNQIRPTEFYCQTSVFPNEFMMPAIDDTFYFGSSRVMDLVESFFRAYANGNFFRMVNSHYSDSAYKRVGYGVLLYKWLTLKNILPRQTHFSSTPIFRQQVEHLTWPQDFAEIMNCYSNWNN